VNIFIGIHRRQHRAKSLRLASTDTTRREDGIKWAGSLPLYIYIYICCAMNMPRPCHNQFWSNCFCWVALLWGPPPSRWWDGVRRAEPRSRGSTELAKSPGDTGRPLKPRIIISEKSPPLLEGGPFGRISQSRSTPIKYSSIGLEFDLDCVFCDAQFDMFWLLLLFVLQVELNRQLNWGQQLGQQAKKVLGARKCEWQRSLESIWTGKIGVVVSMVSFISPCCCDL